MPNRVIVLGGGVAGMSAAHELIERGFEVLVLERGQLAGGKARSIPVTDDGAGTSGHERAIRSVFHRAPIARGAWISFFSRLLQACYRHDAAYPVI